MSRSTASTSCPATQRTRRMKDRPVPASRSRCPAARCGWSAPNCASASSARLAQRLNCAARGLSVEDGVLPHGRQPDRHDYWSFAGTEDFAADIAGSAAPKPPSAYKVVGQPVPRRDLIAKVTGRGVHPRHRPARHAACPGAAAALPRAHGCRALDEAAIRKAAGGDIRDRPRRRLRGVCRTGRNRGPARRRGRLRRTRNGPACGC